MKKKSLAILCSACLVLTMFPAVAFAHPTVDDTNADDNTTVIWGDNCLVKGTFRQSDRWYLANDDSDKDNYVSDNWYSVQDSSIVAKHQQESDTWGVEKQHSYSGNWQLGQSFGTSYTKWHHHCSPEAKVESGTNTVYFHDIDNALNFVNKYGGTLYPQDANDINGSVCDKNVGTIVGESIYIKKDVTIDLTYSELNVGNCNIVVENGASLTIKGSKKELTCKSIIVNGKLTVAYDTTVQAGAEYAIVANPTANVEIDGTVIAKKNGIFANGAVVEIDYSYYNSVVANGCVTAVGNAIDIVGLSRVYIYGGKVESTNLVGICQKGLGSALTITGGEVAGYTNAIQTVAGRLDINPENRDINIHSNNGYAIVITKGMAHPEIKNNSTNRTLTVSGGTGAINTVGVFYEGFIYAGTYSSDVSNYVANGYQSKETFEGSGTWVVSKITSPASTTEYTVHVIGNNFVYTSTQIKPLVWVTDSNGHVVSPLLYRAEYGANRNVGEDAGSVTVYSWSNGKVTNQFSATAYFDIVPKTVLIIPYNYIRTLATDSKNATLNLRAVAVGYYSSAFDRHFVNNYVNNLDFVFYNNGSKTTSQPTGNYYDLTASNPNQLEPGVYTIYCDKIHAGNADSISVDYAYYEQYYDYHENYRVEFLPGTLTILNSNGTLVNNDSVEGKVINIITQQIKNAQDIINNEVKSEEGIDIEYILDMVSDYLQSNYSNIMGTLLNWWYHPL